MDYKALPAVFGGDNVAVHDVNNSEELMQAFEDIKAHNDRMHYVEVKWLLKMRLLNLAKLPKRLHLKINNSCEN